MNHYLAKSEPSAYSWEQLLKDKKTAWTGVRNYAARNFLREMKKGDLVLFYHSNEGKEVVGIAKVVKEAYQDPTTTEDAWVCVDLAPFKTLKKSGYARADQERQTAEGYRPGSYSEIVGDAFEGGGVRCDPGAWGITYRLRMGPRGIHVTKFTAEAQRTQSRRRALRFSLRSSRLSGEKRFRNNRRFYSAAADRRFVPIRSSYPIVWHYHLWSKTDHLPASD